ncbi:MAG: hypothetical protein ABS81_08720 [Pseudonocardia sp. SCN 72-86]|nr:MAG: hypothetical protein ABS81_08720 [Pseudonocardia sp. SCN 72-86]
MSADKNARHVEVKAGGLGLACGGLTAMIDTLPFHDDAALSTVGDVTAFGYTTSALLLGGAIAHNRWRHMPHKRLQRELGDDGWLNRFDLRDSAGAAAMHRQAAFLRSDLASRPGGSRRRRPAVTELATHVGKVVSGPFWMRGRSVYSPHSRGTLVLGPQGSGKSSWLVHKVFDFPGGVYVSSTKPELAALAAAARASRGPVHVFNPANIGGLASSFGWDPVQGCDDQAVADAQAWALVRGGGGAHGVERSDFWAQKAQEIIRCYLMAAALAGYDMGAVHYWATKPDDPTPVGILETHPDRAPSAWVGTFKTHLAASPNTRTGYFATVVSCVGFMDNPTVAAACRPAPGQTFDIHEFLRGGALFVIAGDDKRLSPLITALTEHVFRQAKIAAAACPGGRLPRGLAMILDEVAQTTPVPLDKWAADSRGWGIDVTAVVQDLAQLRTTWGPDRAKTIYANLPTKVVLPGVASKDDLEELAYLAGRRHVQKLSHGESVQDGAGLLGRRSVSTTRHVTVEPVISGETIYGLPPWHAYVLGLARRAVVVKFEPGHKRARRVQRQLNQPTDDQPHDPFLPPLDHAGATT